MATPPKYKMAVLTWLAIYPLITAILYFFGPLLLQVPLALRTLILTAVLVPLMVYIMIPLLQKAFRNWLKL